MWLAATRVRTAPGEGRLAVDRLARRRDRQAARRRDAEGVHRLADDVLAQHRAEGGAAVAAAREPRPSRPFQLDVEALAGRGDLLAEQDGAAVAEHREVAELVAGVGLGDGPGAVGQGVAGENGRARRPVQGFGVEAEVGREAAG